MSNTFGKIFRVTTFGESHGRGIGVIIDGCPAGVAIEMDFIQSELDRRRPAQSAITTQRKESDTVECLSGVWNGMSTGAPIALWIANHGAKSRDYDHLAGAFRPSHADYTYHVKYNGNRDFRGGGRSSARETAARVAAGAVAKLLLRRVGVRIVAYVSQVGHLAMPADMVFTEDLAAAIEQNPVRCPDALLAKAMEDLIKEVRKAGDTVGGVVNGSVWGVPAGWGEPVFDKLHAQLGKAILGIHACKGFEYGAGFSAAGMRGSEHNDLFIKDIHNKLLTHTNFSGGIQGGISNGMEIYFRAAFKPVATLLREQPSFDTMGNPVVLVGKGRHDPCVVPRAVPIVEAMTALVLADMFLRQNAMQLD